MDGGFYMIEIEDEEKDDNVYHYWLGDEDRLILDTIHGSIIIDVRPHDVNSFVISKDGRKDILLIPRK